MEAKINWGIVGPGNIATKFVQNLKLLDEAKIVGVASRSLEKAERFSKEHNIEEAFGSYKALFSFEAVDIVYIATPHRFHKELSIEAMNAGKHVLCEKPLGVNRGEVEELVSAARKNNVFLMEGLWSRFNPSIKAAKKMIDDGEIGDVNYLHADFSFYALDRDEQSRLLNPNLASGSLLDVGIYPIFLAYLLLGKPKDIHAVSIFHSNGTELQTSMIFEYSKAQASLFSGFTCNSEIRAGIFGSEGELFIHPRWHQAHEFSRIKNGETEVFQYPLMGNGLFYEIEEVHRCLREKRLESSLWTHQNSLDLADLLDAVRGKSGIVFPFEL
ncbi:Gfo/Idh/MocA family oxidoreductase [Muricauda sp. JGD-17]|uniref:Gfo/Idh/MocA family oxidoreductase n=1 Tax=Flagellimonas ochracea TaxID=2696472 RepID=A0A964WWU5_9FLAO|nr:Gfo/Idh/MocA family oxidoreductase [Allomuricauda ochracea]NAY91133.1 Gfo/Idh/MocA family oxidoreductase [Allomuricauda ochracea]